MHEIKAFVEFHEFSEISGGNSLLKTPIGTLSMPSILLAVFPPYEKDLLLMKTLTI